MRSRRIVVGVALAALTLLVGGPSAVTAHQTNSNRGVSVKLHVDPNDEPEAGGRSAIRILKVRPRRGKFSWRSCRCRLKVTHSSGSVVLDRRVGRVTRLRFPRSGAFKIVFSGKVRRGNRFAVPFGIRAS